MSVIMSEEESKDSEELSFTKLPTVVKGNTIENYIKKIFEKEGYLTFRISGSKPFDLVALLGSQTLLIEVKSGNSVPKQQFMKQMEIAKKYNCIYVTVTRDKDNRFWRTYYLPDGGHYTTTG